MGWRRQKTQIVYGNENIHSMWYLPVPASHVYQNSDIKDNYTKWRLWCQPAMFPNWHIFGNIGYRSPVCVHRTGRPDVRHMRGNHR